MGDRHETPLLEVEGLVVRRGGRALVNRADLQVDRGGLAVIEGASGSGKSTFLRAVATLVPADGGRIALDGVDAGAMTPWAYRRKVAYLHQSPPMFEGSVLDNLAMGPRLAGRTLDGARAATLLQRVGLDEGVASRQARTLSGGERQRMALARALANDPEVLLLDEPTSALDPDAAHVVLDLARTMASDGLAVVVVTHSREHAARLGGTRYGYADGRLSPVDPTP